MASKRRLRQRACHGKQRHPDRDSALRHVSHLILVKQAKSVRAYKCRFCKGWHVGHFGHGLRGIKSRTNWIRRQHA